VSRSLDTPGMRTRCAVKALLCVFPKRSNNILRSGLVKQRGFTLVEVVICLLIVLFAAMGAVAAITYTRLNMELEKQRLSALGYCRQAMEAIQSLDTAVPGSKRLVPFNNPNISDLDATLELTFHEVQADGTIDNATTTPELLVNRPVYTKVTVRWLPYGAVNRPQEVSMATIVTRGID